MLHHQMLLWWCHTRIVLSPVEIISFGPSKPLNPEVLLQRVERLRDSLHFIGSSAPRSHIVFVDDAASARTFSAQQHFDTLPELLGRTFNRPKTAQLANSAAVHSR